MSDSFRSGEQHLTYNILDRGNSIASGAFDIERGSSALDKNCFRIVKNIATGETSQAITIFHFFDHFHFFDYFKFFDYFHFFDFLTSLTIFTSLTILTYMTIFLSLTILTFLTIFMSWTFSLFD